jgi:hypothetical protein
VKASSKSWNFEERCDRQVDRRNHPTVTPFEEVPDFLEGWRR